MSSIELPYKWAPRPYQWGLWEYLASGGRNAIEIAHRRWGKDEVALNWTAVAAHQRVASYVHFLPQYAQARKALWEMVNPHTGKRRIDEAFPDELIQDRRENEMFIRFKNGSTWQLAGSDNYNALMGTSFAGMIHSEYALADPAAHGYFAPILMENGGWQLFITTPRGKNHAKVMYDYAVAARARGEDWYAERSPASQTKALDAGLLGSELGRLQGMHGESFGRALWLQEYECSFDAAIPGSIFGDCIEQMRFQGRLTDVEHDSTDVVYTAWDLGRTDDTVIWWFQLFAGGVRVIDFHASSSKDVPYYVEVLDRKRVERGFRYGTNYLPHDARPRTLASPRSILQQFMDHNARIGKRLGKFVIAPRLDKQEQIQAARATLNVSMMDQTWCADGVESLVSYHREWDEEKQVFSTTPVHDKSSHAADAFMTLALCWKAARLQAQEDGSSVAASEVADRSRRGALTLGAGASFGALRDQHLRRKRAARNPMFGRES